MFQNVVMSWPLPVNWVFNQRLSKIEVGFILQPFFKIIIKQQGLKSTWNWFWITKCIFFHVCHMQFMLRYFRFSARATDKNAWTQEADQECLQLLAIRCNCLLSQALELEIHASNEFTFFKSTPDSCFILFGTHQWCSVLRDMIFFSVLLVAKKLSVATNSARATEILGSNIKFYDLIFVEGSELYGIVWFIIGSVCKLFHSCSCALNFRIWRSLIRELSR